MNLFKDYTNKLSMIDIDNPDWKNISKVHDWKNYVPYDWQENWQDFTERERQIILDTHLGSGSSRIAAYKGGFNFVGFEIDAEYYDKQEKRFNDFKSQLRLF